MNEIYLFFNLKTLADFESNLILTKSTYLPT